MTDRHATSRALPLLAALTCGVLLALALQVLLADRGVQIADIWREMIAGSSMHLRSALGWWVIAGFTLVAGAIVARPLAQFKPPWVRLRALRWVAGAVTVFALAHMAHAAALPDGVTAPVQLIASAAAICLGALMAVLGAMFALRA